MRGESTPHEPHSNQYGAKPCTRKPVKLGRYLDKIIIICWRKVKSSTKIRGEEKVNLPNKAYDICWDFTFNPSLKEN